MFGFHDYKKQEELHRIFLKLSKEFQSQRDKEKEIERECLAASLDTGDRPFTGVEGTLGFLQELVHIHVSSLGQRRI